MKNKLKGTVLVLVAILAISGSAWAQKFPPVNLLPAELQKEAAATEAAYRSLISANTESAKSFACLKRAVNQGNQSKIQEALEIYEILHDQHSDSWWKVFDQLFKCSEMLDRLAPLSVFNFLWNQRKWDQYFVWSDFIQSGWEKASPNTEEQLKVLAKAWQMASRRKMNPLKPVLRLPLPKGPVV